MAKKPNTIPPVKIAGDAGFNAALDQWAQKTLDLEAEMAALEAALAAVRQPAEERLAKLRAEINAIAAAAEDYAFAHRSSLLPGDRKTAETALAEWSLRLDPPSLAQAGKAWPLARSIESLQASGETDMLTTKVTLNKEAIHAQHGTDPEWLRAHGLRIVQDERFHLTVKRAVTQPEAQ